MQPLEVGGNDFQTVIQELALQNASLRIENAALRRALNEATDDTPVEVASMNGREAS